MRNFASLLAIAFLLVALVGCRAERAQPPLNFQGMSFENKSALSVRYVANEGVLISSGGKQVLIDGLHREYKRAYLFPPPEMSAALESARAPFDKIDLVLVSHVHLDHFHPQSVALHLKNNPHAVLATSEQVAGEIAKNSTDYEQIKAQIKPVAHEWKKAEELSHDGIKIRFLGLRHSGQNFISIQNLGHLIEINGKKLLHIGDADMTAENFAAFRLFDERIDVAFIPYWFLLSAEGRALVREQFDPKQIIAVHIPPDEAEEVSARLKKDDPGTIAFTKILEEKSF